MQRVVHPVHERQLVLEVGDDRRHVVQGVEPQEGRAALEVDEHEVQHLGRLREREAEHEGPQQFGLA